jgi:membrane protease YdiL (CAAX protease family)
MSVQLLFNLVLVFLGGSLLMIRRYRLEPRRAMALRAPPLAAWPATLLGAPALFLVGTAIARLSGALFPVPEDLAKRFAEALVPPSVPLWELLLLVAVLPGICEEIAFRGLLLHGLRRRLHPALLPVVVGAVFGLFHLDLLRLLPTTVLGAALTVVVLLTGSLYPAILWHALNNATAILAVRAGVDLDALPPWAYVLAAIVAAACFTVLWRTRRPYPGLRGSR